MSFSDRFFKLFSPAFRGKMHRMLRDTVAMFSAVRDPAVPWTAKAVSLASLVYLILPVDVIPDFIPAIGMLDDLAAIPLACYIGSKMVPPGIMSRLRDQAEFKLVRWGPILRNGLVAFLAIWIFMAGLGGCMLLRERNVGNIESQRVDWEKRVTRDVIQGTSKNQQAVQ